jgi:hypothetical protein
MTAQLVRPFRARQTAWMALATLVTLFTAARAADAQTRFEWASSRANVEHYASNYECLAAARRVSDSVSRQRESVDDTIVQTPALALEPVPAPVKETVQRCEAHIATSIPPLSDFAPRLQLYLLAGRDSDAASLVGQRFKALAPTASERALVLDTAVRIYINKPARLAAAEPLLIELQKMAPAAPLQIRMVDSYIFMKSAQMAGDTMRARRAAEYLTTINTRISAAERIRLSSEESANAGLAAYAALTLLHRNDLLDSLRRNVTSFIAFQRSNWALATGERAEALHLPLGEQAPTLEGDYWFGRSDSTAPRPTRGKVNLVVSTLPSPDCALACAPIYATLRRLAQRFPELEVTLEARTLGYVSLAALSPADEAEKMRHWWLDEQKIPAALAVTKTDFWRLPVLDRRRIDRETPNESHYAFGPWKGVGVTSFVIDRSGRVVSVAIAAPENETYLSQIIEILLQQQAASR